MAKQQPEYSFKDTTEIRNSNAKRNLVRDLKLVLSSPAFHDIRLEEIHAMQLRQLCIIPKHFIKVNSVLYFRKGK